MATGVDLAAPWRFDGRTESVAVVDTLTEHGLAPEPDLVARVFEAIGAVHAELADRFATDSRTLPGAREALAALDGLGFVHQSVLTGNLREVSVIKLAALGLDRAVDLRIGAFGSDAAERVDLASFAFRRAADVLGLAFTGSSTVVIGDTPRDIEVARAVGGLGIGVATGSYSIAQLDAAGADVVLPDLTDTGALLEAMGEHFGWDQRLGDRLR